MARLSARGWWAIAGAAAMLVGCFGKWAKLFGALDVSGLDIDDGKLTAVLALIAIIVLAIASATNRRWPYLVTALIGIAGTAVTVNAIDDLNGVGGEIFGANARELVDGPGWGLWLSAAGSVSLALASVWLLFTRRRADAS